jgi:hypothetical protein
MVPFLRTALVGALAVALTMVVSVPPAAGYAASEPGVSTIPSVVQGAAAQTIYFYPPFTGSVGDSMILSAFSDSGLPVSFSTTDPACTVNGSTLIFVAVGTCSVRASQVGDDVFAPAPNVTVAIQVSLGYNAIATATRNGVVRTTGAIQVGDDLTVTVSASGTSVTACSFGIKTAGGWMMSGAGAAHADGSCDLVTVVPEPSDAPGRSALSGRQDLDLCVSVDTKTFADGSTRVMSTSDRTSPGGYKCYGTSRSPRQDEVLDFAFDGTGTPAPFSSSPKILSWNIADWDPSYVPLQFNTDWDVAFPAWVTTCQGPYLNGDWVTVYRLVNLETGCPDWSLRLPGVLPATMPWGGGPGAWGVELVVAYTNDVGDFGLTITTQQVPYQPSDGVFQSSFPAISPTDLAADRFVHVGEPWQPTFRISGVAQATSCSLHLNDPAPGQVLDYVGSLDAAGLDCAFTVPAFADEWAYSQYYVSFGNADLSDGQVTYAASITAIAPPEPPTIPDPTANSDGTTTVAADAGAGQGMSLEVSVSPDLSAAPLAPEPMTTTASLGCSAVSYASILSSGGDLAQASSDCALASGKYVVAARMVDATGTVTTSSRTITVLPPPVVVGSSYVPIAPLRVVDSRTPTGVPGIFRANIPRTFQVAGVGNIPADAVAVTGNVTVVGQNAGGYVSVTTASATNPTSSTINFPLGDNRANNITIPLAGNGKLSAVFKAPAGKATHLIVDITGYFLAGDEDATYSTVTTVRVLDTRPGIGTGLAGAFSAGTPRKVTIAGTHGIPADAIAITGNLTVVGQTRAGYLSITKTSIADPTTSTLNFPLGDTRANGVSVPLNLSGALWIVYKATGGSAHVVLDVTGYYRDDPSGLLYYPLAPRRTMDTRPGAPVSGLTGPFNASSPRRLQVAGQLGIPTGAEAITGNLTVVNQTAAGYVSATLNSEVNPTTSVLNFPLGDTRANGVTLPLNASGRSWFVYKAPSGKTTHLILDVSGYFR